MVTQSSEPNSLLDSYMILYFFSWHFVILLSVCNSVFVSVGSSLKCYMTELYHHGSYAVKVQLYPWSWKGNKICQMGQKCMNKCVEMQLLLSRTEFSFFVWRSTVVPVPHVAPLLYAHYWFHCGNL